jgi:HEAT repeat protein
MEASNALLAIVKRHAAGSQLLDDEQQELLRAEALKLLAKKDGDPVRVLQILGPVADYSCRQKILAMTKHRAPQVRLAAIEALGTVVDDSCVDELAEVIRKDELVQNQLAAVKLLASMATPRAHAELKRLSKQRLQGSVQDAVKLAADRLML